MSPNECLDYLEGRTLTCYPSLQLDTAHLGWGSACAPHKPLRQSYDINLLPDLEEVWRVNKSFIWDHKA